MVKTASPSQDLSSSPSEKRVSKVELIKEQSHFLREPLATELQQDTDHFSEAAVQVLKFHGAYQQDDRDLRQERKQAGLDRAYSMMLRTRVPGGFLTPQYYLTLDHLAEAYGNGTMRLTTRQAIQLHGILKKDLKTVIADIVHHMGSSISACGDVNRNVMAPAAPYKNRPEYVYAQEYAVKLADLLTPLSEAYYDIWVDGEKVELPMDPEVKKARLHPQGSQVEVPGSVEPLYGTHYLPRKFKCAIGVPSENTVDIYSQDIGVIVITDPANGKLKGFNILVGGGMGRTHHKEETFPLLGQPLGFVTPEEIYGVIQAIVAVQRDYGERFDRRLARMKYLVHHWGIKKFRKTVEEYFGKKLKAFRPLPEIPMVDYLGWRPQGDGKLFLGLSIENGRIQDTKTHQLKTAIREITHRFGFPMRLTPTQDLLFTDIPPTLRSTVDQILKNYRVLLPEEIPLLIRQSMACPALPTCGLAVTESERALPGILRQIETLLQELGLDKESFIVRMTGCPNGCARPYLAELGFVGSHTDQYQMWLGGSPRGDRLAQVFQEKVPVDQILTTLKPLLLAFKAERYADESFGDYCHRAGLEYLRGLVRDPQEI
jgi:sulfite reductase (ferredoxin)